MTALRASLESKELKSMMALFSEFTRRVAMMVPGQRAIISNGRIIGPLDPNEHFIEEDFALLERHSTATHLDKIKEAFNEVSREGNKSNKFAL